MRIKFNFKYSAIPTVFSKHLKLPSYENRRNVYLGKDYIGTQIKLSIPAQNIQFKTFICLFYCDPVFFSSSY